MNPSVINAGTKEYKNLVAVAKMLEAISEKGARYEVRETYFDYGQNWKWTTILRIGGKWGDTQILSPRQQKMVLLANTTAQLAEAVEDIRSDKYFNE